MAKLFNETAVIKALYAGKPGNTMTAAQAAAFDTAFPNNTNLKWSNAAGTAEVSAIKVNASNKVELGSVGQLNDANGNEQVVFSSVSSAVNEVTMTNAATGNKPIIRMSGETNGGLQIQAKGTGTTVVADGNANEVIIAGAGTASAVNEVTVTNAATGHAPVIAASGGDTDISVVLSGKGTGIAKAGDSGTASCTGATGTSTATSNTQTTLLTTASLTTAAAATHTITLTNSKVVSSSNIVGASVWRAGATTGVPYVTKITPGTGTVAIEITNIHASAAVNGTLTVLVRVYA